MELSEVEPCNTHTYKKFAFLWAPEIECQSGFACVQYRR